MADLSPLQRRKIAAIVGACVADAAAQPLHWVYKDEDMSAATQGREDVEFLDPSANPYYRIPVGRNTCYGDQAYVVLKSLVDSKGLNMEHLSRATYDFFGPSSEYEKPEATAEQDGKEETYPIIRPWRNGCLREFVKNIQENKTPTGAPEDDQIDCVIRSIPLVVLYAGRPEMLEQVEKGIRMLQESDLAVTVGLAAARILEQYILQDDPGDVLTTVAEILSDPHRVNPQELDNAVAAQIHHVLRVKDEPHATVVPKHFKKSCNLPESFQSSLHGLITSTDYVSSIRSTIRVGGCNASRCGFIGACLGAKDGIDKIPGHWKATTRRFNEVLDLAQTLVTMPI